MGHKVNYTLPTLKQYDRNDMLIRNLLLGGVGTRFTHQNPLTNEQELWQLRFVKPSKTSNKENVICLEGKNSRGEPMQCWIADGLRVLGNLTGIHLKKNQSGMINMLLPKIPEAIRTLFSWETVSLSPLPSDHFTLEMNYGTEDVTLKTMIALRKAHWVDVLKHSSLKRQNNVVLHPALSIRLPITIGSLTLGMNEAQQLTCGDLLLIEQTSFTKDGGGTLDMGPFKLFVHIAPEQPHYSLTINSWEKNMSNEPLANNDDELISDDMEVRYGDEETQESSLPVSDLPMKVDVRLGSIKFTVKDLGNLVEGKLYPIDSATPGQVQLMSNDMELARGQLVEVDGKLAIEITRRWVQN